MNDVKAVSKMAALVLLLVSCGTSKGTSEGSGGSSGKTGGAGAGASGGQTAIGGGSGTGGASANGGTSTTGGTTAVAGRSSGGSTTMSGGTTSANGGADNGGAPLRPPNPRTDIGPADGVVCKGDVVPEATVNCPVNQQCCPGSIADAQNLCVPPGTTPCANCTFADCGAVLCDGPEDCPGRLCCYTEASCVTVGASCDGKYGTAQCADRCETPKGGSPQVVVCKDPRDCLRSGQQCIPRSAPPYVSECT